MGEIEYAFAWEGARSPKGPWGHLRVVEFRGTEGISSLFRYEIVLCVKDPALEVDPEALIGAPATLRIATLSEPGYRFVNGIVTEAEELGSFNDVMSYRIILSPPLVRAMHRTRCRVFVEKTTRQIIDTVLQGDPALRRDDNMYVVDDSIDVSDFRPSQEIFAWRVADASRIDDPATRPFCVQYNESDLAFVSRLLEEEGISYHFENGTEICLLVLSDSDTGRTQIPPTAPLGAAIRGRSVTSMKLGARLRPRKVSLLDYNWKKPALSMAVQQSGAKDSGDLVDHEYPGRYPDTPDQGKPLAVAKLDRLGVEARYAVGEGTCRVLSAGTIFSLEHPSPRHEGEYLITKLQVRGVQHGVLPPSASVRAESLDVPYSCTFECARRGIDTQSTESRFRPARVTPKPRILGTQTAFVTAEPGADTEINVGGPPDAQIGCVRLRFHWDQETERHAGEPTSCWVRVNQVFAGVGDGAVFHPRVGVEVIVDFEDGDPDRPIVVGRVYNGQNRPPTVVPTVSTFKTMTSPGGGSFNELTLDATAGSQQIKLHTPKDWNSEVGDSRSETVGNHSTSTVGINRTESTGGERSTKVEGANTEAVQANESISIGANRSLSIANNASESVGADRTLEVKGNHTAAVGGHWTHQIAGNHTTTVGVDRTLTVSGTSRETVQGKRHLDTTQDHHEAIQGNRTWNVGGSHTETVSGVVNAIYVQDRSLKVGGDHKQEVGGNETRNVDGNSTKLVGGRLTHTVTGDESHTSSANRTLNVTADHTITVGAQRKLDVTGDHITTVGAHRTLTVSGTSRETVQGERHLDTAKDHYETCLQDRILKVNRDHKHTVGGDHTHTVSGRHTHTVGGDHTHTVSGHYTHTVTGDHTHTVIGHYTHNVSGDHTHNMDGDHTHNISGNHAHSISGNHAHDVDGNSTHTVGGALTHIVGGPVTHFGVGPELRNVVGALTHIIDGEYTSTAVKHKASAEQEISFDVGECKLTIQKDKVTIKAGESKLVISSNNGIQLVSEGQDLHLQGKLINLNSGEPPSFDDDEPPSSDDADVVAGDF